MKSIIERLLKESITVKQAILADNKLLDTLEQVATACVAALLSGNKVLLAGNGGSASDAQHIAAELVGRFEIERSGLAAIALNTNVSNITAIANDFGYEAIFSRQIEAIGCKGDVFFGFSTSGNSANVVKAIQTAKDMGIMTVGMSGDGGGAIRKMADYCLCVPSKNTARVQESHITIGHILCALIEDSMAQSTR